MIEQTQEDKVFDQLDKEKIVAEAEQKATAQAQAQVESLKQSLLESLGGKKEKYSWEERGRAKPDSYDELFQEVKRQIPTLSEEDIEKKVEQKLAEREQQRVKQEEESRAKETQSIEEKRKAFDMEWYDLVQQGKMPAMGKEVEEKIKKGDKLTRDEILSDPGLKARLELANLSTSTGKSAKLAFYEEYTKKPTGSDAPVFGSRPSGPSSSDSDEYTYDDIARDREKKFGF